MSIDVLSFSGAALSYGSRRAVSDFTLSIAESETLAIVGESGCGKTTVLKAVLGLPEYGVSLKEGSISLFGKELSSYTPREHRAMLGRELCLISQNPDSAFNPIRSYRRQFRELLKSHGCYEGKASEEKFLRCMESLALQDAERILRACPYEMSGGMKQRIAIAAALLMEPKLLLLDEPTSALDVTTQKTVLDELLRCRSLCGTAMLLITHDLGVAAKMAERIGVMYAGRLVELGSTAQVLQRPLHPYTRALLRAVPKTDGSLPEGLEGVPPLYGAELPGCGFAERCRLCRKDCRENVYQMTEFEAGHYAACGEGSNERE